jgi:hypothetical protein
MSIRDAHNLRQHSFFGVCVAGLLLLAGFATPAAFGQTPTPPTSSTNPNAQAIAQLQSTRALLHKANHDYQGYRAKGMHQITLAIHALEGTKAPHQPKHKPGGGQTGGHEAQQVSDAQLAQAIQQLQAVETSLVGNANRHVAVANGHINKAIQDLQTALKIK